MRISTLLGLVVVILSAFALYQVKYEVHEVKKQVAALQSELEVEYDALHVLEAEWAYLTRPERLRKLSHRYLKNMKPMNGKQLMHASMIRDLPLPKEEVEVAVQQPAASKLMQPASEVRYGN